MSKASLFGVSDNTGAVLCDAGVGGCAVLSCRTNNLTACLPGTLSQSLQVLDLTKQQEVTKQHESKEREAEFRRQVAALEKVRRGGGHQQKNGAA